MPSLPTSLVPVGGQRSPPDIPGDRESWDLLVPCSCTTWGPPGTGSWRGPESVLAPYQIRRMHALWPKEKIKNRSTTLLSPSPGGCPEPPLLSCLCASPSFPGELVTQEPLSPRWPGTPGKGEGAFPRRCIQDGNVDLVTSTATLILFLNFY